MSQHEQPARVSGPQPQGGYVPGIGHGNFQSGLVGHGEIRLSRVFWISTANPFSGRQRMIAYSRSHMQSEHENTGLASSLTDLMTSLAVIFVLLLVAMLNNALQQTKGTESQVLSKFDETLKDFQKEGVEVQTDPKDPLGLLVVVPEGLLKFEQGKSEIPAGGKEFVQEFIPKFVDTACSAEIRPGISSIVVEGHTSSEGDERLNLRLSQARSTAVVQASLDVLDGAGNDNSANHKCFVDFISATGRGSAEPVTVLGREDQSQSRRVVFKIRVKSLEQRGLETKLGELSRRGAEP